MASRNESTTIVRQLWPSLDWALPDAMQARVVAHLEGCVNCRSHFDDEREFLAALAFLGGVLTILSPCILPVLPLVFGRGGRSFARARDRDNVRREVARLGITSPVVMDNAYTIWRAFNNRYWPAAYYADATGRLRFHHFGEGRYDEQDTVVARLLAERDAARTPGGR
ncbi:MAG: hypothetical protein LH467_08730 [Gemmatimonadaceae bacterium]|nr:hypothetical protein [Gemmatimonadaceae bacterium]